ncbi:MAG: hypothetical protein ABH844_05160 [Candidatus Omnitrophota bacterium]
MKKIFIITLFFIVFALGTTLRLVNLTNVSGRSPDEDVYTYQAKVIAHQGFAGVKDLIKEYNSSEKMWLYPNPVRVGYYGFLSVVMKLSKNYDVIVGAYLACVFSVISLLLLTVLGLRFFNKWITLYSLLFLSVSAMDLAIARRAWQDSMFAAMSLFLVYLTLEITRSSRKIIWYIPFIIAGSWSLLIKETGVVVYELCLVCILWMLVVKEKAFLRAFALTVSAFLCAAISLVFLARVSGGFSAIIEVLTHLKETMPVNGYAVEYQSGPWYEFLEVFWIISPVNSFLCLVGTAGTVIGRVKNRALTGGLISFVAIFIAMAILPCCQNLRYVSVIFVPFYLIGGVGLWCIISYIEAISKRFSFSAIIGCILIVLVVAAAGDYYKFQKIVVKPRILDLSIRMVREFSQ